MPQKRHLSAAVAASGLLAMTVSAGSGAVLARVPAAPLTGERSLSVAPGAVGALVAPEATSITPALAALEQWAADQSRGRYTVRTQLLPAISLPAIDCAPFMGDPPLRTQERHAAGVGAKEFFAIVTQPLSQCYWYRGAAGARSIHLNGNTTAHVTIHEFGHLVGLGHARSVVCSTSGVLEQCTDFEEYGDIFDVMGTDTEQYDLSGGMSDYLGWADRVEVGAGGDFTLRPNMVVRARTERGEYVFEWVDRTYEDEQCDASGQECAPARLVARGVGWQARQTVRGVGFTWRLRPDRTRWVWGSGEAMAVPGAFEAIGDGGVLRFRWTDQARPRLKALRFVNDHSGGWQVQAVSTDNGGSGVDAIEVRVRAAHGRVVRMSTGGDQISLPPRSRAVSVRVRDRAGNWSAVRRARVPAPAAALTMKVGAVSCDPVCMQDGRSTVASLSWRGRRPAPTTRVRVRIENAGRVVWRTMRVSGLRRVRLGSDPTRLQRLKVIVPDTPGLAGAERTFTVLPYGSEPEDLIAARNPLGAEHAAHFSPGKGAERGCCCPHCALG